MQLRVFAIASVMTASPALGFFGEDRCPDFETNACLEEIRALIDQAGYDDARDAAEAQCYSQPETHPVEAMMSEALLAQASGCFYLYSIEQFLGRQARAFEAKDRARRITALGCEQGHRGLCELLSGFMESELRTLAREFARDVKGKVFGPPEEILLREVTTDRALPRSFQENLTKALAAAFPGGKLKACNVCRAANAKSEPRLPSPGGETRVLDVRLGFSGGDLTLDAAVIDLTRPQDTIRRSYGTQLIRERYALLGKNALLSQEELSDMRTERYEPLQKVLVGLGVARIPNLAPRGLDDNRLSLQIRSVERFNRRRSEFGLLVSVHATQNLVLDKATATVPSRALLLQETDEEEEETEIQSYPTAFAVYGIYSHMLIGRAESYDSFRQGVHVGLGGYFGSKGLLTGTARLGLDFYFGRRWVFSACAVGLSESTVIQGDGQFHAPAVYGSEVILSYNL